MKNIGITVGDPHGIGPEIVLKALTMQRWKDSVRFRVYSPRWVLEKLSHSHQISLKDLDVIDVDNGEEGKAVSDLSKAGMSLACIKQAVNDCKAGHLSAIVTAPLHKGNIRAYDQTFIGHTELLAKLTNTEESTMFMVGERLRVGLVTTHMPVRQVSAHILKERVLQTIKRVYQALKMLGYSCPRIAVVSLNPHGTPHAELDIEEKKEILPAIKEAKEEFVTIEGTISADVAFRKAYLGQYDGIVAMYHDQALGAFKMIEFDKGVNVTLGLPFIRTSPGHGTAYDIAGKWIADPRSMISAIEMAIQLAF